MVKVTVNAVTAMVLAATSGFADVSVDIWELGLGLGLVEIAIARGGARARFGVSVQGARDE